MTTTFSVIGQRVPRIEGVAKVSGAALYSADIKLPGKLWGKVLRSPFPHARIVHIDASRARALPGVYAVLTAADVPPLMVGRRAKDQPLLCRDRVRFVGDRVAAVAAVDLDVAEEALSLIEVQYEELPAVFTPEEALQPGAPLVHDNPRAYAGAAKDIPDLPNLQGYNRWGIGDVDRGFAESDLVFEQTFTTPRVHQVYLEPHTCAVAIDDSGRVQVWASNKQPYTVQAWIAEAAGVPSDQVTVHPIHIGGDFGGKGGHMDIQLCYFLAKAAGRPVVMALSYTEELMAGDPRHASTITLKTGLKRDGRLWAREARMLFDGGAYAAYKPMPSLGLSGASKGGGPYRIPHCRIESFVAYTNNVPCGHMRGPGSPQALFAVESHMDFLARELGMDPLEFRLLNAIREGDVAPNGERWHNVLFPETLQRAKEMVARDGPKAGPYVGRGIAAGYYGTGTGESGTIIQVHSDGSVVALTALPDTGTGNYTILQQIVAEVLQRPISEVTVRPVPPGMAPVDSGSGASRVTNIAGNATLRAAQQMRETLAALAAEYLGCPAAEVEMEAGWFHERGRPASSGLSWADLAERATRALGGPVQVTATYARREHEHEESFVVYIADVEVDPDTGQVQVRRLVTVNEVGPIINPINLEGQLHGGLVMGLGFALMEELRVEGGRVMTVGLNDYKVPTVADLPPLEMVLITDGHGPGPFGAKGVGELSVPPTAPAIANAVYDAVGVRITDLPITAEKVYRAMREARRQP